MSQFLIGETLMDRRKKIAVSTLVLLMSLSSTQAYAANVNSYKDKLNSTNSSIKDTQNKINSIKNQSNEINSKVSKIEEKILSIQNEIDLESEKLQKLEIDYINKQKELDKLKIEYKNNYKIFENQLVSSYTSSFDDNYSKVIFSSSTLADFILGNTYFKYLLSDKDKQLQSLDANMDKQAKLLEEIELNKKECEEVTKNLNKKRESLEKEQSNYQDKLNDLKNDANELGAILDAQSREASKLEAQIKELQDSFYNNSSSTTSNTNSSNNTVSSKPSTSTGFGWPTDSQRVTSKYGYRIHPVSGVKKMHTGIDIGQGMGAPIYASAGGTVIYADWRGGYGKTIIIDHGNYISTLYAHLNDMSVRKGQKVSKGQRIGSMGSTGVSTGPHLHFEVRKNGQHQNPLNYIK